MIAYDFDLQITNINIHILNHHLPVMQLFEAYQYDRIRINGGKLKPNILKAHASVYALKML